MVHLGFRWDNWRVVVSLSTLRNVLQSHCSASLIEVAKPADSATFEVLADYTKGSTSRRLSSAIYLTYHQVTSLVLGPRLVQRLV